MRVGLLGAGRIGRLHARLLRDTPGIDEVLLADADPARATEVAAETGITATTSIADTIATVDAVVIAAATSAHAELVRASMAAGKPTFCEKPPALSLAECQAMADAVDNAGSFFQMGFMRRFDPGYAAAKEKIAQGAIGRPVVFKSSSRDPFRPSLEYANPASSGGIMVDMGIHDFDLARWFMGDVDTVLAAGMDALRAKSVALTQLFIELVEQRWLVAGQPSRQDLPFAKGREHDGFEVALAPGDVSGGPVAFADVEDLDATRETLLAAGSPSDSWPATLAAGGVSANKCFRAPAARKRSSSRECNTATEASAERLLAGFGLDDLIHRLGVRARRPPIRSASTFGNR